MSGLKLPLTGELRQLIQSWHEQLFPGLKGLKQDTDLDLRWQDPSAYTRVQNLPDGKKAISLIIPLDDNSKEEDGRILLKDTYVFDSDRNEFKVLTREYELLSPIEPSSVDWRSRLLDLNRIGTPSKDLAEKFAKQGMLSHFRPFYNNPEFWTIVRNETEVQNFLTRMAQDAQEVIPGWRAQGADADSHYLITKKPDQWILTTRWVFDKDAEPGNGRIFIQDRFVMDPQTRELTDFRRSFVGKDYPYFGEDVPPHEGDEQEFLKKLNELPQPEWEDAKNFFDLTRDSYFLPVDLNHVGTEDPKTLWNNKEFFKNLGTVGNDFLRELVADARKIDGNLFIRASHPKNQYQFRQLGGRTELLFRYLVTDYDDPGKNQIVCYDRFVFKRDLSKLYTHSRYYEPLKETFSDPSLLDRLQEVNASWQPNRKKSLEFLRQITPSLREPSVPLTEESLASGLTSESLPPIPEGFSYGKEGGFSQFQTDESKKLLREGVSILSVMVLELLQREYDRSQGWAHFGPEVALGPRQDAAHSLFLKLKIYLTNFPVEGLGYALKKLNLNETEEELRQKLLTDPLLKKMLDLGSETDPRIRDHELMTFAREDLFKGNHLGRTALAITDFILRRSPENPDAKQLAGFAKGAGSIGTKIEYLGPQLLDQVLDGKMLVAMMGAGIAGSIFEAAGLMGFARMGSIGRLSASGLGIAGEAASFTTLHKIAHSAVMDPAQVWSTWKQDTLHAMLLFGFLRVTHGSTAWLGQQMAKSSGFAQPVQELVAGVHPTGRLTGNFHAPLNGLGRGLLGTLNFVGGVESMYLANQVGKFLEWVPQDKQGLLQDQFDAFTTYLTAMVGYRLADGVTAGKLSQTVGEWKLRSRLYRDLLQQGWKPGDVPPEPEKPAEVPLPPESPPEEPPPVDDTLEDIPQPKEEGEVTDILPTPEPIPEPEEVPPVEGAEPESPLLRTSVIPFDLPAYQLKKGSIIEGEKTEGVPKLLRRIRGFGELAAITEEGPGRKENQDNFGFAITPRGLVMIVADGMGGERGMEADGKTYGGKESANLAMNLFMDQLIQGSSFEDSANLANQAILEKFPGTGVCFAAAEIIRSPEPDGQDFIKPYWAGDTKLYLLRRDAGGAWQWVYRTQDNSLSRQWVDLEIEAGSILPANRTMEIVTHPRNNVVLNGLGRSFDLQTTPQGEVPDPGSPLGWKLAQGTDLIPIEDGDLLIIQSDSGPDNEIKTKHYFDFLHPVRNAQEAVERSHAETVYRMNVLKTAKNNLKSASPGSRFGFVYDGQDSRLHGKKLFINGNGFVYDAPLMGNLIGKFAMDNITVAAYLHRAHPESQAGTGSEDLPSDFEAEKTDIINYPPLTTTLPDQEPLKTVSEAPPATAEISGDPLSAPSGLREPMDFSWKQVNSTGRPEAKESASPRASGLESKVLQQRVMKEVRTQIVQQISAILPLKEIPKAIPVQVMVNLGDITGEPRFKNKSIRIDVTVLPEENTIHLDLEWLQMVKDRLAEQKNPNLDALLASLQFVHGMSWFEDPQKWESFIGKIAHPKPPVSLEIAKIAEHNRLILQSYNADVTTVRSRWASDVIFPSRYLVGKVFIDEFGYIVSAQLSRPLVTSRSNVTFPEVVPEGSVGVPVIVAKDTVVWADKPRGLNDLQEAALREMTHGTQSIKSQEPYAVKAILKTQEGPLAIDMAVVMEDFIRQTQGKPGRYKIKIVKAGNQLRAFYSHPQGTDAKRLEEHLSSHPTVGVVMVEVTPGEDPMGPPKNIQILPEPNLSAHRDLILLLKYLREKFLRIR